jgi:hypothetical protein
LPAGFDRAAEATATELGSLHTRLRQSEARLTRRLESIDTRLRLQAGLIQSGAGHGWSFGIRRNFRRIDDQPIDHNGGIHSPTRSEFNRPLLKT